MRLLTSGVDLPQIGSLKDRILTKFQLKEDMRSLCLNKIHYINAVATAKANGFNKEGLELLHDAWRVYTEISMGLEPDATLKPQKAKDEEMLREYVELYQHTKPKLYHDDEGNLCVTGLV